MSAFRRRSGGALPLSVLAGDRHSTGGTATHSPPFPLFLSSGGGEDSENGYLDKELDVALEEGDLRSVTRLLRERPRSDFTREQWDRLFAAVELRTAQAEENTVNVRAAAEFPLESEARQEMTELYSLLKRQDHLRLYGAVSTAPPRGAVAPSIDASSSSTLSASTAAVATTVPAAGSHTLPPQLLESILGMPMSALTPQPTNTILFAGVAVALLEALISASTGISLNVLALSTLLFVTLDRLFVNGAIVESLLKVVAPQTQTKIVRHEAGHLLAAYLLGCPVEGIVLSAWAALQDRRFGMRQVSAGTSFFDPQLSKQINSNGKVTRETIDRYSIIVMAGIAAEAENFGRADGGAGDEMALVAFLSQLNGDRGNRSVVSWNYDSIRNQARWGALQAVLMLRQYRPAYDALVDALERGGTLGDCIYAIEKAARDNDLQPLSKPVGYITDKEGSAGEAIWTNSTLPVTTTHSEDALALAASSSTPTTEKTTAIDANNEKQAESALEMESSLKEYRAEVEEKLRIIEERLKEIQD